jgi:membrane glycosyltransferase
LLVFFVMLNGLQATLDHLGHRPCAVAPASSTVLFLVTLLLLFGPKFLSLAHLFSRPRDLQQCGGPARVMAGVVLETLFSILTAPIMMWFHTRFVLRNLFGQTVSWHAQTRDGGSGPRWGDVFAEYWPLPVAAAVFGAFAWWANHAYAVWLVPLLLGLCLAIPLAQWSSRKGLLTSFFQTPEEIAPPPELVHPYRLNLREGDGFVHALLDPYYNAVHVSLQRKRNCSTPEVAGYSGALAARLLREGPEALTGREKRALLADGAAMAHLHGEIWKTPAQSLNPFWTQAIENYRRRQPLNLSEVESRVEAATVLAA